MISEPLWSTISAISSSPGSKNTLKTGLFPPLARLERFFDDSSLFYQQVGFTCGCPIGNLSQEMSDLSEPMRSKLSNAYSGTRSVIKNCVIEAAEQGAIKPKQDVEELAVFILNGWEGALIDMKVSKSI